MWTPHGSIEGKITLSASRALTDNLTVINHQDSLPIVLQTSCQIVHTKLASVAWKIRESSTFQSEKCLLENLQGFCREQFIDELVATRHCHPTVWGWARKSFLPANEELSCALIFALQKSVYHVSFFSKIKLEWGPKKVCFFRRYRDRSEKNRYI